jgi:hypothetical protein
VSCPRILDVHFAHAVLPLSERNGLQHSAVRVLALPVVEHRCALDGCPALRRRGSDRSID